MASEDATTFCSFTGASTQQAQQYLALTDGNVEQAVDLFFSSPDLGHPAQTSTPPAHSASNADDPITIDDDDEDVEVVASRGVANPTTDYDEAMARQLQEELYGDAGRGGANRGGAPDTGEVRAPMARTTETLVGPGSSWQDDPNEMNAAIAEQMAARQRQRQARPGIFNQSESTSIWAQDDPNNPQVHREVLSRATGGVSDETTKSNLLADLFRPPFDLISRLQWSDARDEGKENKKWILVNVQDPSIFDCQVLNRDIWKNPSIRDTIKEHFVFLQYNKNDPRGQEYVQYYFANMRDSEAAYPHISIVDPRTGEQVKTWSGSPAPKASDFLMDLHEFLDRYSLRMDTKNPVQAKRKGQTKDVAAMSEEEMLALALQNSVEGGGPGGSSAHTNAPQDTADFVAASAEDSGNRTFVSGDHLPSGSTSEPDNASPFDRISSNSPHQEPVSADPKETTRIQFRHSDGRVVRRFSVHDPVRRIYEWLKAAPFEHKKGQHFELISMGKNLIENLDESIGDAGLKQGTVMVEFTHD